MNMTEMWKTLIEILDVSEETLQIITSINGYNEQTLCDVLYVITGYRTFEQFENETCNYY